MSSKLRPLRLVARVPALYFIGLICVILLMSSGGCGEHSGPDDESHTKRMEVIFGDPFEEMDQLVVRAEQAQTHTDRISHWQNVSLSRATALMYHQTSTSEGGQFNVGNATLTNTAELFTADHVTFRQLNPPNPSEWQDPELRFHFHWLDQTTSQAVDNPWYFRLRLKALGLDGYAVYSSASDLITTFDRWEWEELENWEADDKDISLIHTPPRTIDQRHGLLEWRLAGPGVFFDFREPAIAQDQWIDPEHHAIHIQQNVPAISNPATNDPRVRLVSYDNHFRSIVSHPATENGRTYVLDFTTNTDTRKGSSGSSLFTKRGVTANYASWIGIYSLCSGYENGNQDECPFDERVDAGSQEYEKYFSRLEEDQRDRRDASRANEGEPYRSSFADCQGGQQPTCYDECVEYCADPANANDPTCVEGCWAVFPPTTGLPSDDGPCVGSGCSSDVRHLSCRNNFLAKTNNPDGIDVAHGLGVMGAPLREGVVTQSELGLGELGIICGPFSGAEWSMNWDFVGYQNRPHYRDRKGTLTYLNSDHRFGEVLKAPPLSFEILQTVFWTPDTVGSDDIDRVAAMPFQMCPPGFVMRGLDVQHTGEDPGDYIIGITALRCVDIREPTDPRQNPCLDTQHADYNDYPCRVPTAAQTGWSSKRAGVVSNPPPSHYAHFDISQYIGNPHREWSHPEETVTCADLSGHVVGLYTSADTVAPTSFIGIECQAYK